MHPAETAATLLRPELAMTGLFALLYVVTAVYAWAVPQGDRRWWVGAALLAGLVVSGLLAGTSLARTILLDLAALAAVGLVWIQPGKPARQAARTYLVMMVISIICVAAGLLLGGESANLPSYPLDRIAVALLVIGFALKLALVPFFFWLPGVAAASAPMTTALIIATLDMAEFAELLHLREAAPWVFTDHYALWMALALLSMFGGALLALAQRDIKRMLAYSTIDDMGYLLLGVLIGSQMGLRGALLGMFSHALFKIMLFGAVGIAERTIREPLTLDCCGLARTFPVSSAMFIAGSLGMLGVPPLFGFAGRWRLYLAGVQSGGLLLGAAMAAATALALFYYVRAIHRVWLGQAPGRSDVVVQNAEPRPAAGALIFLAVLALVLGFFPSLISLVL